MGKNSLAKTHSVKPRCEKEAICEFRHVGCLKNLLAFVVCVNRRSYSNQIDEISKFSNRQ